jgi:hypothetical protein
VLAENKLREEQNLRDCILEDANARIRAGNDRIKYLQDQLKKVV